MLETRPRWPAVAGARPACRLIGTRMTRVPVMEIMPWPSTRQHGPTRTGASTLPVTWPDRRRSSCATVIGWTSPPSKACSPRRARHCSREVGAADVSEPALLATASRLRARHPPDLVGAALTQVRLRVRARAKFGADADRMYFTPAGLEQSTRASVAAPPGPALRGPAGRGARACSTWAAASAATCSPGAAPAAAASASTSTR